MANTLVVKLSVESSLLRESKATSEGELTRVRTCGVRVELESSGNTRYISTVTPTMVVVELKPASRPVNVALLTFVVSFNIKSSAASISNLPVESGRVAIAIVLRTPPVEKLKATCADDLEQTVQSINSNAVAVLNFILLISGLLWYTDAAIIVLSSKMFRAIFPDKSVGDKLKGELCNLVSISKRCI